MVSLHKSHSLRPKYNVKEGEKQSQDTLRLIKCTSPPSTNYARTVRGKSTWKPTHIHILDALSKDIDMDIFTMYVC